MNRGGFKYKIHRGPELHECAYKINTFMCAFFWEKCSFIKFSKSFYPD